MTKPVVVASLNDTTGQRCVDIRRLPNGAFDWLECRRDPEDPHGWRVLSEHGPFPSEADARSAAQTSVGWLET
ncbi:MAG: hypothetical protein AAFQ66_03225 [Pseudomonadota bacterium]